MRASRSHWVAMAYALGTLVCAFAFIDTLSPAIRATGGQRIEAGVYTEDQARRGQELYESACLSCHGATLEGEVGPPLTGEGFLALWGARPLSELVDKIHNTMPLQADAPLLRSQSLDLTAYILQRGHFPAGRQELIEPGLADIALPGATLATDTTATLPTMRPMANLAQLMRSIAFPNSNVIFNVQLHDPGEVTSGPPGARPFDYVEWGSTVYPGWEAIDLAALALVESTPLFLLPGRRCENGRPVPVERDDWKEYTEALINVGRAAYRASQSRRVEAVVAVTEQLDEACANCHQAYRDVGAEGRGAGSDRCRSTP